MEATCAKSRGDNFKCARGVVVMPPVSRHAAAVHGAKLQHELRMSIYLHPAFFRNNRYVKPGVQSLCKQHHWIEPGLIFCANQFVSN